MADNRFKARYANALQSMMEEKLPRCGIKATPYITSRLKTLKRLWQVAYDIVYGPNTSGFGWDPETKLVTADKEVWDEYMKAHPMAKEFRTKALPNFDSLCMGIPQLLLPIFPLFLPVNLKQVQLNANFAIHIPSNSNLVTQVSLPKWTFNLAISYCWIQKLLIMGKAKRTDNHLNEYGITREDIEAFREHKATLRWGGRTGRSKEMSKDPNVDDEYAEAAKWKRELQAKDSRKKKRAAKKNDQTLVTGKSKAPSDDDVHSVSDSSPKQKKR
ncbi:hypothetical protein K1719_031428 [Acacia pycnantha]|nr:hypothetical protein K1719_031428 [Acacia pycnantha]